MRIAPSLHLVASGGLGFDLTSAWDCNVWLADSGDGLLLFDAGAGLDGPSLLDVVAADGLDPARITHVFLTHAHADHSGGAAALCRAIPGLSVCCGRRTAEILAENDERLISLDRARQAGVYPADYRWTAPPGTRALADEAEMRIGEASIRLIETPGHSDDHCAYLLRLGQRVALLSGDSLFYDGRVLLQDIPDCSVAKTIATVRRLAGLGFDTFLPGHGLFSLRNGMRHVARANGYAERMLPPPQVIG